MVRLPLSSRSAEAVVVRMRARRSRMVVLMELALKRGFVTVIFPYRFC
jgi:hypothetical protein